MLLIILAQRNTKSYYEIQTQRNFRSIYLTILIMKFLIKEVNRKHNNMELFHLGKSKLLLNGPM